MDCFDEERSRYKVQDFIQLVERQMHLRFYVRQVTTMEQLLALSRRIGAPLQQRDLALTVRVLDQPWWPWFGWSMEARQFFVCTGDRPGPGC